MAIKMDCKRTFAALFTAACFCFYLTQSTFATNVSMTLTSPGSTLTGTNALAGVYVGAYEATINGVSTPVICDDFGDESYVPESWTASSSAFSNLSSTKWAANYPSNYGALYNEAAWLIEQMINPVNASQLGEIQYAIWGVFSPTAITDLTNYNAADGALAQSWLNHAQGQAPSDPSSFTVYTPVIPPTPTCYNGQGQAVQCASSPPQEFIVYNASEPPSLAILCADLLLLGLAIGFLRRRQILNLVR